MGKLEGIRAVVFAGYGTLFNLSQGLERLVPDAAAAALLFKRWQFHQSYYAMARSLMGVHADYWQVSMDALGMAVAESGLDPLTPLEEIMALLLQPQAFPDVEGALKAIKACSKPIGLLSNASPAMLEKALRHSQLERLIDVPLSIEEVGIYKPSRRAYRLVMQKLHVQEASAICYVSAQGYDACAAAQFGFQSVWLRRHQEPPEQLPKPPEATLESLDALLALLSVKSTI